MKIKFSSLIAFGFALWLVSVLRIPPCLGQNRKGDLQSFEGLHNKTPEWFKDAKFGIYFHWGVYSVPAFNSEWYSRNMYIPGTKAYRHQLAVYGPLYEFGYKDFIPLFRAPNFDPDQWAALFARSGAKFAGPVAEHADGFSMWDSNINPWNAKDKGPGIDVVGAMERAVHRHGMKFIATFHHQWQWGWYPTFNDKTDTGDPEYRSLYGPVVSRSAWKQKDDAPKPDDAFCRVWAGKVEEVIKGYHPDILYFDSRLGHIKTKYRREIVSSYLRDMAKEGRRGVILRKHRDLPDEVSVRNYEKSRMNKMGVEVWQTEETISTYSWCYTRQMKIRTAAGILHSMIDVVSKNGIYLLNISPKADGTIPEQQKEVLLKLGGWLQKYGSAIYHTRPWYTYGEGPAKEREEQHEDEDKKFYERVYGDHDIRYTRKEDAIYAILLGKPRAHREIVLNAFDEASVPETVNIKAVTSLETGKKVKWSSQADGLHLTIPGEMDDPMANVLKIETAKTGN